MKLNGEPLGHVQKPCLGRPVSGRGGHAAKCCGGRHDHQLAFATLAKARGQRADARGRTLQVHIKCLGVILKARVFRLDRDIDAGIEDRPCDRSMVRFNLSECGGDGAIITDIHGIGEDLTGVASRQRIELVFAAGRDRHAPAFLDQIGEQGFADPGTRAGEPAHAISRRRY